MPLYPSCQLVLLPSENLLISGQAGVLQEFWLYGIAPYDCSPYTVTDIWTPGVARVHFNPLSKVNCSKKTPQCRWMLMSYKSYVPPAEEAMRVLGTFARRRIFHRGTSTLWGGQIRCWLGQATVWEPQCSSERLEFSVRRYTYYCYCNTVISLVVHNYYI